MVSLHISIVAHVERPLKINIMDQILQSSLLTKWFIVTTCVFFSEIELIHAALNGVFGSQEEPPSPSVTSLSSTFVLLSSDTFSTILSSTEGMNGEEVGSKTLPQLWIDHEQMSQSPDWSQTVSNLSSPLTSVTSSPQTYISTKSDTSGHIMTPPRDTREGDGVDSSDFKVRCRIPPCPTHGQWNISHSSRTDGNCPSDKMVDSGFYLTYKCNTGYFKCQQRKLVCNDGIWEPSAQNLCLPDGCRNLTLLDPLLSARYTHNGETKCFNASHQQNGTVIQYSCKSGYKIQDMDPRQATCSGNSWTPKQIPSCVKDSCQLNSSVGNSNRSPILLFDIPDRATGIGFKVRAGGNAEIILSSSKKQNDRNVVFIQSYVTSHYTLRMCQRRCDYHFIYSGCWSCVDYTITPTSGATLKAKKFLSFWIRIGNNASVKYFGYSQRSSANVQFCNFVYDSDFPTTSPLMSYKEDNEQDYAGSESVSQETSLQVTNDQEQSSPHPDRNVPGPVIFLAVASLCVVCLILSVIIYFVIRKIRSGNVKSTRKTSGRAAQISSQRSDIYCDHISEQHELGTEPVKITHTYHKGESATNTGVEVGCANVVHTSTRKTSGRAAQASSQRDYIYYDHISEQHEPGTDHVKITHTYHMDEPTTYTGVKGGCANVMHMYAKYELMVNAVQNCTHDKGYERTIFPCEQGAFGKKKQGNDMYLEII